MKDLSRQSEKYRVSVKKPAGGFVFIKAEHLLRAWWAYRQGIIDLFAFRVWLASHELVSCRCTMNRRLTACYRVEELLPLAVVVNLSQLPNANRPATVLPPPRAALTTQSPPLKRNRKLSSRYNNQKLAHGRTNGVQTRPRKKAPPNLRRITLADLREPQRLDSLFAEAVECGIIRSSQANRLDWFAAAERALQHGTTNPCGFFATIVHQRLWSHISNAQEDSARHKLKKLDFGEFSLLRGISDAA
jgi:hypothetical protein